MPTYPDGFPPEVIAELEKAFGRKIICNKPYSGTQVIHDYGREQKETGALIVYTSADSVLQIAAHEDDVPVEQLYDYCRMARKIMQGEHGVGRIIARPYVGEYPNYTRTPRRHDFSLDPTGDTKMDALVRKGLATIGVGKISVVALAEEGFLHLLVAGAGNGDGAVADAFIDAERCDYFVRKGFFVSPYIVEGIFVKCLAVVHLNDESALGEITLADACASSVCADRGALNVAAENADVFKMIAESLDKVLAILSFVI